MMHWFATYPSPFAAAVALGLLWLTESLYPFFRPERSRHAHGVRNLALGLFIGLLRSTFFPAALFLVATAAADRSWGVLNWLHAPAWAAAIAAVLLLDLVNYAWHVASHQWRWLWRFHAVHHHDESLDSTTAFRFHAGDVLFNAIVILIAVAILGLRVEHVLLYEAILLPVSIFHHGNIRIPERIDRPLRAAIVTPRMHWVHHSRWFRETDSNYSGVFSFWDRLFGTFRLREDPATLRIGLDGYEASDHATLRGCLATPFGPIKSLRGRASGDLVGETGLPEQEPTPLASPATHPSHGRLLPLALAVAAQTPATIRTLRPCPTLPPDPAPATVLPTPG
jgi:sterol desaturase/sphingolipid hydroxylase (fatty acid hydroxylase superfamily)